MKNLIFVFPLMILMTGSSNAGLLPAGLTTIREGDGGAYRYTYSVEVQSKSVLQPGDFFTIYDFAGRVDGTETQPANFSFSSENVGPTPDRLVPKDDHSVANLTWTYTGKTPLDGDAWLGEFSVVSMLKDSATSDFTGQSHRQDNGHFNNNITDTAVPVPSGVPEPSAWVMASLALLGLAAWGYRRGGFRPTMGG